MLKLQRPTAEVFVPDGLNAEAAIARTTHMAICAHQDDVEISGFHGIETCFGRDDRHFTGVVCSDGAGSPRAGIYADYSDERMRAVRRVEQRTAASIGRYGAMAQLDYPSAMIKTPGCADLLRDLATLLNGRRLECVYLHNLADKHDTHLAVAVASIQALRALPRERRPAKVLGGEIWRGLDWINDDEKVALDCSRRESLAMALMGVFDSQVSGGKRYDLATQGRRRANATYLASHGVDTAELISYAMDLTPLVLDEQLDVTEYVMGFIQRFEKDVRQRLQARMKT